MCLIAVKKTEAASFSVQDFRTSWGRNSDGTGVMYVEDGRVIVDKCMGSLKDQLNMYYKHMHRPQLVVHQRYGTNGEKTVANVHPFKVLSIDDGDPHDLYMVHNGVISMNKFSTAADKKMSDTALFCYEYLTPLMRQFPNIIDSAVFQIMLHDFIGSSNKLVFMSNLLDAEGKPRIWIFNKAQGAEHNGCWLSNKYSIETNHTRYNTYKNHGANTNFSGADADDYDDLNNNFAYGHHNSTYYARESWSEANKRKSKALDTLTGYDIDTLMENLETYSGLPEKTLEDLFISEPHLVVDMINLLSEDEVKEAELLNGKSDKVGAILYDLLQTYTKKKAA